MIDNIKILIYVVLDSTRFSKNDYCFMQQDNGDKTKYLLINSLNNQRLKVYKGKAGVYIVGSWRKWFFGSASLEDLSRKDILTMCKIIAQATGISLKAILNSRVLKMELGQNFHLPVYPFTILNAMYCYSNLKWVRWETSLSFRGYNYWLTAYDKNIEVNKRKLANVGAKTLKETSTLRIELKAFRASALRHKLRGVEKLKDIINGYRNLAISLYHEVERIEMEGILPKTISVNLYGWTKYELNDYMQYFFIKSVGLSTALAIVRQLKMHKGGKSKVKKDMVRIYNHFNGVPEYSREDILRIIRLQICKQLTMPNPLL